MVSCITDEMRDTYAVAGTPDEVRDQIRRWEGPADAFTRIVETFRPG